MKYHFKAVAMLFAVSIFLKIYLNFEKNMQVPSQGKPKAKVHFLGSDSVTDRVNVTDTDSDSDTDSGSDNDSVRIAIYFCYIVTCDFFHDD